MKIALIAQLKNGGLLTLLREQGWSGRYFASLVGVGEQAVSSWMNFHSVPSKTLHARIEAVTGRLIEDLFPPELVHLRGVQTRLEVFREVSPQVLADGLKSQRLLQDPARHVLRDEAQDVVWAALDTLTDKERAIITQYFGFEGFPKTFELIAKDNGVGRERIRQIFSRGMKKLRHPSRSTYLWDHRDALAE